MTDVIAMAQSCSKCGKTVTNDMPEVKHPLEFLQALRERGWDVKHGPEGRSLCPLCKTGG